MVFKVKLTPIPDITNLTDAPICKQDTHEKTFTISVECLGSRVMDKEMNQTQRKQNWEKRRGCEKEEG